MTDPAAPPPGPGDRPLGPPLILIAAMARGGVIGRDGGMPWHLPADLKHFKQTTLGSPMVLGRRTWESFGSRPLPGRPHLLVSRQLAAGAVTGATVFAALEDALAAGRRIATETAAAALFVIGGGTLYAQTLDRADALILTEIDLDIDGDTRFPKIDAGQWRVRDLGGAAATEGPDGHIRPAFTIRRYDRR
jgi:dihydrofolate reductase